MAPRALVGFVLASLTGVAYTQGGSYYGNDNNDGFGYGRPGGSNFGDDSSRSGFLGFDIDEARRDRTAHGVLAAIAFILLFPLGAVLVRVRGRYSWLVHGVIQCVAYVLYIAAAALGIKMVDSIRIPPSGASLLETSTTNAHPIIGILLLAVLFLQPPLGYAHHLRFKRLHRRTWITHAHLWLGRAAVTLGIINGGLGLDLAGASRDAVIAYSVIAAVLWLLWLGVAIFAETRRRRRKRDDAPVAWNRSTPTQPPPHTSLGVAQPGPLVYGTGGSESYHQHRNFRAPSPSADPTPPYTPRTPAYGDAVEMVPIKDSTHGGETREAASSSLSSSSRVSEMPGREGGGGR